MVLVGFGWIHTKFCSFALVAWHRLQQRKLILAKNETHKKQKHNQNTESPKTTRQDSPEKTTKQKKTQKRQKKQSKPGVWQVLIILCFPSLFFLCALVLYVLNLYSLCCSALSAQQARGVAKKGFRKNGDRQIKHVLFFSSATWVSRKHEKYKTKGAVNSSWPMNIQNRHTHVKCINRGAHGTLRNPGDAHGMVGQHVRKKYKGSGV